MKNQARLVLAGFLVAYSMAMPLYADETKTTWQKWKKPVIATTMVVGGIAGWLLLDYYLNGQFNSKLGKTTQDLVSGRESSFFERNGQLRKHPFIVNPADYQLYENARFDNMLTPLSDVKNGVVASFQYSFERGRFLELFNLSHIRYLAHGFNIDLLANQIGSKLCFLVSLLGGYWLMQPAEHAKESEDAAAKTVQS